MNDSTRFAANQGRPLVDLPVLPLRDVVVYPHMVVPLFVGRQQSVRALDAAMSMGKKILLLAQKTANTEQPKVDDLYTIGTIATILQLLKLPDGTIKVLVEGEQRAKIVSLQAVADGEFFRAVIDCLTDDPLLDEKEAQVLSRSAQSLFEQYIKLNKKIPVEILSSLASMQDESQLADTIAAHMPLKVDEKQKVLELVDSRERLEHLISIMGGELDLLKIEKRIRGRVKKQMEKSQREYYLNEQIKAIQKELGDMEESSNEIETLASKIAQLGMPKEAREKANTELNKLKMMSPMSAEATVVRNYIDTLASIPWRKRSKVRIDLVGAEHVLEDDHFGLDKVKERILEYLAVQRRVKKLKGPILCLVGPPGVGKTSLGRSIARATGRKFVRMSLGGTRDEAEIRGHRRTYIGSMPGKIVQNLIKVGKKNPLFLLDEIDKMAMDFRGDPSSALLEVLDPEQNNSFVDHYLEVELDLSDVMFVATANNLNIPAPLLDRMEVIRISGYTEQEKLNIATKYLVPRKMADNGLEADELTITEAAIRKIIRTYTREAGVRNLERELAKVSRKVVKQLALGQHDKKPVVIDSSDLQDYLGVYRYRYGRAEEHDQVGQVTGLAWTEVGGELLTIESAVVAGKGKFTHTGQLGDVMQESIQAAMTVVRSRSSMLGLSSRVHAENDIHIHVPEGATPKDGPSAGIGMCTALVSALTNIAVRSDVAMTGEITLRGEVLPIGGLKEKLLAAHRGGITTVLIPQQNEKDLADVPKEIVEDLDIRAVGWIDEVLEISLQKMPIPIESQRDEEPASATQSAADDKDVVIRPH